MSPTPVDVLLVAAHRPELAGLEAMLGDGLAGRVGGLSVAAAPVGIGLAAAGGGTASAVHVHRPRAVVLLGSYGHYPEGRVTEVLQPRAVVQTSLLDAALADGRAALPGPIPRMLALDGPLARGLAETTGQPPIDVATTLGITTDDALAEALGGHGQNDGENLELYAVVTACDAASVKVGALLVSTNAVGSAGRQQWLAHNARAAAIGVEHIGRWLSGGAAGLS